MSLFYVSSITHLPLTTIDEAERACKKTQTVTSRWFDDDIAQGPNMSIELH